MPNPSTESRPARTHTSRHVREFLHRQMGAMRFTMGGETRTVVKALFLGAITSVVGSIGNPLALRAMIDKGIRSHSMPVFTVISLVALATFTGWRVLVFTNKELVLRIKRSLLQYHVPGFLLSFYTSDFAVARSRSSATELAYIFDEVKTTLLPYCEKTLVLFTAAIGVVAGLGLMLSFSIKSSMWLVISVPVFNVMSLYFTKQIRATSLLEQEHQASFRDKLNQAIAAFATIRLFGETEPVVRRTRESAVELGRSLYQRDLAIARFQFLGGVASSATEMAVLVAAGYQVMQGLFTFGEFFAFLNAFWITLGNSRAIIDNGPDWIRLKANVERLMTMYPIQTYRPRLGEGGIRAEGVSLTMNGGELLRNISLQLGPGSRTLIRGSNGAGKSTLALVLAGVLQPSQGEVFALSPANTSIIMDPMQFPPGPLLDILPASAVPDRVCDLVDKLGLDGLLSRSPTSFSAGERKKAQILYGLSRVAEVYVFDEPLAHLDPSAKQVVMELIFRYTPAAALVVIMHGEESYTRDFESVYTLQNGNLSAVMVNVPEKAHVI